MSQDDKPSFWQKIKQRLQNKRQSKRDTDDADSATAHAKQDQAAQAGNDISRTDQVKSAPDTDKDSADIVAFIKHYFEKKQWHYTHYPPKSADPQRSHHLSLHMKNKNVSLGYLFRVQESNRLVAVYGILPFLIPESHQSAAMLLITQINYDMIIGNLEMDISDGEIRFKHAIDVDAVGIDDAIIEHLLHSVIAMTHVAYEIFGDLLKTPNPSEDMPTLLLELRAQADARTFFLPTDLVQ